MHPLIRLHSLLVFIILMALGGPASLAIGLVLLAVLYLFSSGTPWHGLYGVVWRIRWLLLSILVLYGWWTPGTPLVDGLGLYAPTVEGLTQGAVRAGLLVAIVAAVHWVMMTSRRNELLGAVLAFTRPLQRLGLPHERLAVRIVLTLETVPRVQTLIGETLRGDRPGGIRLKEMAARAHGLYGRVLEEAATAPLGRREIMESGAVPSWQWLIPIGLGLLLWSGHGISMPGIAR